MKKSNKIKLKDKINGRYTPDVIFNINNSIENNIEESTILAILNTCNNISHLSSRVITSTVIAEEIKIHREVNVVEKI